MTILKGNRNCLSGTINIKQSAPVIISISFHCCLLSINLVGPSALLTLNHKLLFRAKDDGVDNDVDHCNDGDGSTHRFLVSMSLSVVASESPSGID